jgi:hypothetical protein
MDVHPQRKSPSAIFLLISRYPLLVLGLGWAMIMVVATFGLATLLSPKQKFDQTEFFSPPTEVSPSPQTITTPVTPDSTPDPDSNLPVFTSPADSLEPEETSTASPLPLWTLGAIAMGCAGGSFLLTIALKQVSANSTKRRKAKRKSKKRSPSSRRVSPAQQSIKPEPQITVIPSDVTHPLDTDEQNLATEMDLRKRHSLSSLLRDS